MNVITVIQGVNLLVFLLLGGIHLYWVFGGTWGAPYAIPSDANGKPVFKPRKMGTLLVAGCLIIAALLSVEVIFIGKSAFLFIGLLFGLRVIGDFKYVGLGKKIKNTRFARKDATVFIPLCIYLSLSNVFLFFW